MKKLVFVLALSTAVLSVSANNLKSVYVFAQQGEDKKVEIETTKLSEKITKSITDTNKEGKITKAFQLVDNTGSVVGYEVVVLNDQQEQVVTFDKNGDITSPKGGQ